MTRAFFASFGCPLVMLGLAQGSALFAPVRLPTVLKNKVGEAIADLAHIPSPPPTLTSTCACGCARAARAKDLSRYQWQRNIRNTKGSLPVPKAFRKLLWPKP